MFQCFFFVFAFSVCCFSFVSVLVYVLMTKKGYFLIGLIFRFSVCLTVWSVTQDFSRCIFFKLVVSINGFCGHLTSSVSEISTAVLYN